MRVAAIYDIHGNLPALEAVLRDIREAGVDRIVVGGDVLPGPMPVETIACLFDLNLPVQFISGNGDRETLAAMGGTESGTLPEQAREVLRWTARQLQPKDVELIAAWPKTVKVRVADLAEVLFCHATPRNDTEIFTRLTPEDRLKPIFEAADVPLVICGHTHMQFDRVIGTIRVLNAGSVGMPFGEPGAYWLLLGRQVELRRTLYDLESAAQRIENSEYPQAQDFAERNVMRPPSEEEILRTFTKVELQ